MILRTTESQTFARENVTSSKLSFLILCFKSTVWNKGLFYIFKYYAMGNVWISTVQLDGKKIDLALPASLFKSARTCSSTSKRLLFDLQSFGKNTGFRRLLVHIGLLYLVKTKSKLNSNSQHSSFFYLILKLKNVAFQYSNSCNHSSFSL